MAKYEYNFIAVDTETGGLISKSKKALVDVALTEVAMVVISNDLEIVHKDSWLVKPYDHDTEYTSKAAEVSGITIEMLEKEGIDIQDVYQNVRKVLEKNKKGRLKPIIIFQNKPFDLPFLENLFIIFNDDFHKYIDRVEDTLDWARLKWPEKPKYNLASIADYCGLDLTDAHRALPDTIITAQIFIHFMKCLRGEGSGQQSVNKFREGFKF
jgi:DNA polymerase III epsilon subunit-like protein